MSLLLRADLLSSLLSFYHNDSAGQNKRPSLQPSQSYLKKQYLLHLLQQGAPTYQSYTLFHSPNFGKMSSTLAGIQLDLEEEITLFTCFALATTYDENSTQRYYNTAECKGVARQLLKRKKPEFRDSNSTASKVLNIDWLRKKWRNEMAKRREVMAMREIVAKKEAYYLDRAAKLLEHYQKETNPNQAELIV